jgi:hypothetical protein
MKIRTMRDELISALPSLYIVQYPAAGQLDVVQNIKKAGFCIPVP